MASEYVDRAFVFVAASRQTQANNAAKNWDPDIGGDKTFAVCRCSVSGNEPATWIACNTGITPAMKARIDSFKSANTSNVKLFYVSQDWTWETALGSAGLKIIFPVIT